MIGCVANVLSSSPNACTTSATEIPTYTSLFKDIRRRTRDALDRVIDVYWHLEVFHLRIDGSWDGSNCHTKDEKGLDYMYGAFKTTIGAGPQRSLLHVSEWLVDKTAQGLELATAANAAIQLAQLTLPPCSARFLLQFASTSPNQ